MSIFSKVSRNIKLIKETYKADSCFSKKYAGYRLKTTVLGRLHLKKASAHYKVKTDEWILSYLKGGSLSDVIEKYRNDNNVGVYEENAPIWVCWWTGIETAPELVKQCVKSIYKHSGKHKVHMITEKNYMQYIEIPEYMMRKVADGTMRLAHLSDYIRVSLLEKYGGLWLDATIFCSKEISEDCFLKPFFTCKSVWQECGYISYMQWVTFVLGGWKGNLVYRFIKEAFENYWSVENFAIDYLMFDYIIYIGFSEIPEFKKYIEGNVINNIHRDDLQAAFNAKLPADQFDNIIKDDTVLYKLSWRETYSLSTAEGRKSIYAHFLEMDI